MNLETERTGKKLKSSGRDGSENWKKKKKGRKEEEKGEEESARESR